MAPLWAKYYQTLIDKGLYVPSTFSFLENHLKNGDFNLQTLTVNNGLISGAGREFLVRKGKLQMESEMKYANGIAGIFGSVRKENGTEGVEGYNPVIEKTNNDIAPENTTSNDSLFKRLLGN